MGRFSYGHVPDKASDVAADLRHRHIGALIGASAVEPPDTDYRSLIAPPNQGPTSACVAFATKNSVETRAKIAGAPIDPVSASSIYALTRLLDDPQSTLVDEGSRPSVAMLAIQEYGFVTEARWPFDPANINAMLPEDVFQHAIANCITSYYRIQSGPGSALLVRQALTKGFVPIYAQDVDAAYEDLAPGAVYDGPTGKILGGHAQAICGYVDGAFVIAGSWGTTFADGGFARITPAFFERAATDILVPTIIPPGLM